MKLFSNLALASGAALVATLVSGTGAQATLMHHHHHAISVHHHHHVKPVVHYHHYRHHHHAAVVVHAHPGKCGTFKYYSHKIHGCMDARLK